MPRHLIGDAHEWINEISTVPTHSPAKLQPSQRSWDYLCVQQCHTYYKSLTQQRGKKTLLSLTLI